MVRRTCHIILVVVIVASICFGEASSHRCVHDDEDMRPILHHHGHDRTVPQHRYNVQLDAGSSGNAAPVPSGHLRVAVSALDLSIASKYCTSNSTVAPDFMGGSIICTSADEVLTDAKRSILINVILPRAIKMQQERVRVAMPMTSNISMTPETVCPYFTIPSSDVTYGVPDADFALYVAAGLTTGNTIAWAGYCQLDEYGRPLTGRINFNPKYIPSNVSDTEGINTAIRTAAHELVHALGFSSSLILGNPNLTSTIIGVRGKATVTNVFTAPAVVDVARKYFNCSNITYKPSSAEKVRPSHNSEAVEPSMMCCVP
jgi:hypothetical protein